MHAKTTATILTYAGTLPLIATAVASSCGIVPAAHAFYVASTYSAVIVSFLAGIHWACALFFASRCPRNLLITSNLVALLAWLSALVPLQPMSLLLPILCFLYILVLDLKLHGAGLLPGWFYALRRNATVMVSLSLVFIMTLA